MSVPSSPVTTLMLLAILLRCAPWKCMPLFLSLFLAYLALLGMGILGMAVLSVSIVGYTSWRFLPSLARFFFKSLKCITMRLGLDVGILCSGGANDMGAAGYRGKNERHHHS
uniref:Uncharacterized protein n=1 Tax=Moniliophthora roreri TaxID=221103 RepID=A0A0W0FSE5_MONRR